MVLVPLVYLQQTEGDDPSPIEVVTAAGGATAELSAPHGPPGGDDTLAADGAGPWSLGLEEAAGAVVDRSDSSTTSTVAATTTSPTTRPPTTAPASTTTTHYHPPETTTTHYHPPETTTTHDHPPETTTTVPAPTTTLLPDPLTLLDPGEQTASNYAHRDEGVASWFGAPDGTCAHVEIPKGTVIKVTRIETGVSTTCVVNDWGPADRSRIIDLSDDTFEKLAPLSAGLIDVVIEW